MKIVLTTNPLRTRVELDDADLATLRLKIKIQELEDRATSAYFELDPEHQAWVAKTANGPARSLSLDERVARALKMIDLTYILGRDEEAPSTRTIDDRVDEMLAVYVKELGEAHDGDCVCQACSCMKCRAESLLGINTIAGLDKHEAASIGSAFRSRGPEREASVEEALAYLRDRQPERTPGFAYFTDEQWSELLVKWAGDRRRAIAWLTAYQQKLNPPPVETP